MVTYLVFSCQRKGISVLLWVAFALGPARPRFQEVVSSLTSIIESMELTLLQVAYRFLVVDYNELEYLWPQCALMLYRFVAKLEMR